MHWKRTLKQWIAAGLVALALTGTAAAQSVSRTITLVWSNPNPPGTVDYFIAGWGATPGPPYPNTTSIAGAGRAATFALTGLTPGDTLYFSVTACDGNGQCSPWSTEAAHVVTADTVPAPETPVNVVLIVQ